MLSIVGSPRRCLKQDDAAYDLVEDGRPRGSRRYGRARLRPWYQSPIEDEGWGRIAQFKIPGAGEIGVYEPNHPSPLGRVRA
jgi:hypothetical protein